ncbi:hypothetical protein C8J57DRAFT_1113944, partial [Mycena rebaudengoi]
MDAATAAREAKAIHAGLKALLARDVWEAYKEADFQRKNLRRRYLHLLLLHPAAREARDALTHLWMQTSYAFIALYKARLASKSNTKHNNNNNNTTVETRKLLQRFRQFLAEEERFWVLLVQRLQRAYGVSVPSINANDDTELDNNNTVDNQRSDFPALAPVQIDAGAARAVLAKALVCLGDIARYREQFRGGKGGKHDLFTPGAPSVGITPANNKSFARPAALYTHAHRLYPRAGNAAHQLAILATYAGDTMGSVGWYYRALGVLKPFETAGENLAGVLARVAGGWRKGGGA